MKRLKDPSDAYISHASTDGETWLRPCFTHVRATASDVQVFMDFASPWAAARRKRLILLSLICGHH